MIFKKSKKTTSFFWALQIFEERFLDTEDSKPYHVGVHSKALFMLYKKTAHNIAFKSTGKKLLTEDTNMYIMKMLSPNGDWVKVTNDLLELQLKGQMRNCWLYVEEGGIGVW